MHISRILLVTLLICAAIFCAGCTQNSSSQVPVTPVNASVTAANPEQLALTQSEVPQGFTLVERWAKTPSDLSKVALDLGWQDGYVVRFISPAQGGMGKNEIVHNIAIYPKSTINNVIAMAEQQGRSDKDLIYTDFPVQGLGDNARAFSGKTSAQILLKPTKVNELISSIDKNEVKAVFKNDVVQIIFSKGNTFEVLIMTGPSVDTALLIELAKKAYAKIP
jgi:hypothetical protein